jgi:hypothetical protein
LNKEELIITALQQRIGEVVSNYETQIAVLRAEITEMVERDKAKEEYAKSLTEKVEEV